MLFVRVIAYIGKYMLQRIECINEINLNSKSHSRLGGGAMQDITIDELKEMAVARVEISSLPTDFVGKVKKVEKRADKRGREAIFMSVGTGDGDVIFKYTRLHFGELAYSLEKMGVRSLKELEGKMVRFITRAFRMGNPRHIPVEIVQ